MININKLNKKDAHECDECRNKADIEISSDERTWWLCPAHREELSQDLVLNYLVNKLQKRRAEFIEQLDQHYTPKSIRAKIAVNEIDHMIAMCRGDLL